MLGIETKYRCLEILWIMNQGCSPDARQNDSHPSSNLCVLKYGLFLVRTFHVVKFLYTNVQGNIHFLLAERGLWIIVCWRQLKVLMTESFVDIVVWKLSDKQSVSPCIMCTSSEYFIFLVNGEYRGHSHLMILQHRVNKVTFLNNRMCEIMMCTDKPSVYVLLHGCVWFTIVPVNKTRCYSYIFLVSCFPSLLFVLFYTAAPYYYMLHESKFWEIIMMFFG